MAQSGKRPDPMRPPVYRLVLVQFGITVVAAMACYGLLGWIAAYSAFLGGLVYAVPNAFFIRQVFAYKPAGAIGQIAGSFYKGEALKLLLTALLFSAVFKWVKPLDTGVLFFAFILVLMTNTLAPFFWRDNALNKT